MANATKDERAGNREVVVRTRFTPEESRVVSHAAEKAGMTRAAFMRASALNAARGNDRSAHGHHAAAKVLPVDRATAHELRMIGSNLNQIARAINAGRVQLPISDVRLITDYLADVLDAIAEATGGQRA